MAESTLERDEPAVQARPGGRAGPARALSGAWPTLIVGGVLLAVSTVIVIAARTRPGFDPYGWLVWGQQTIRASLDTNAAPSWKPLPYLFTVPFALFGRYQVWLWMVTSVAVALAGSVFAFRIAYRLTGVEYGRRWPAVVAGVFAAIALLGIRDYSHYILSAQSDPMIVSLCLGAIDCHLSERPGWAFVLAALAGLGRPEVWPFLGLYGLWCWRYRPSMRWLLAGSTVVMLLLWFGIPAITSRTPFVSASNAMYSGRALHNNRVFGTIDRFLDLHETPLELLALLSVAIAAVRRDVVTLAMSAMVVVWVIVEIAFALHGWPGLARYMFEAGGLMVVVAAVGIGRLLHDRPGWVASGAGLSDAAGRPAVSRAAGVAGMALVVVAFASLIPAAVSRGRDEHKDMRSQRARTAQLNRLASAISHLGGAARLRQCGEPLTRLEYQTALAWNLRVNVSAVGFKYGPAIARGDPIVLFTPRARGWRIQAVHQRSAVCRSLPH